MIKIKEQASLYIEPYYLSGEFSAEHTGVGLSIFNGEHVITGWPFASSDYLKTQQKPSSDLLENFIAADTPSRLLEFVSKNGFLFPDRQPYFGTLYRPDSKLLLSEYSAYSFLGARIENKDAQKAIATYGIEDLSETRNIGNPLISLRDCLTAQRVLLDVIRSKEILDNTANGMLPITYYEFCGFNVSRLEHSYMLEYKRWISGKYGEGEKNVGFNVGKYYKFIRESLLSGNGYRYLDGYQDSTMIYHGGAEPISVEHPDQIGTGVLRNFIDRMMDIHLSSIRISTLNLAEIRASYSLISHIWYQLLDSFREGRAGRCEYCGRPYITKGRERGTQRQYCNERHRKAAERKEDRQYKQDAYDFIDFGLSPADAAKELQNRYPKRSTNHFTIERLIKERKLSKGGETK